MTGSCLLCPKRMLLQGFQNFIGMLGVGGELEALDVVAMDQADFENVKKAIMEDGDYQFCQQRDMEAIHLKKIWKYIGLFSE